MRSTGWKLIGGSAMSASCATRKTVVAALASSGNGRFKSTRPAFLDEDEEVDQPFTTPSVTPQVSTSTISGLPMTKPDLPPESIETITAAVGASFAEEADAVTLQPNAMEYTGGATMPITSSLHLVTPEEDTPRGVWPVHRMMDESGTFRDPTLDGVEPTSNDIPKLHASLEDENDSEKPVSNFSGSAFRSNLKKAHPQYADELDQTRLLRSAADGKVSFATSVDDHPEDAKLPLVLRAHRLMIRLREMDRILLNAQRQGRISFYMTCTGEEAIHMGAASALELNDQVFSQYREQGVLMWRGFSLEQFTNQCFSNDLDLGKGRQMPIHYGSRALNFHTVSSPLGTQIPQAAGAAYRLKLDKDKRGSVAVCFFGEGCASTTDFHSGLNFAATLDCPLLFICRNNGYAISTPVTDQYAGDGVIGHAPGYGMAAIRVDGNDLFAVHAAVRKAREYASENNAPVLIEAMTYRQGHHSTSDDSTRYRDVAEVERFAEEHDPLSRIENFLVEHSWITMEEITRMQENERLAVLQAMELAEKRPPPALGDLFTDVYAEIPPHLQEQQRQLEEHMAIYPDYYKGTSH
eukprot:CAMPEP_0168762994 /NCGR_PEP_ID=MMETSP0724-20121128/24131_1 /TAXON_ID=265536 /ORGANISM="Amphiprora sp., Strain CCMP467" /LENGTH=578 /DNA_ID=CAMNT_0008812177 /DNA_START=122 /DNA_END=1858 /DNA_ORIENTATION=+